MPGALAPVTSAGAGRGACAQVGPLRSAFRAAGSSPISAKNRRQLSSTASGSSRKRAYSSAMNSALAPERNVVPSVSLINEPCGIPLFDWPARPTRAAPDNIGSNERNSAPFTARTLEKRGRRDDRNAAERIESEQIGVAANDQIGASVHRQFEEPLVLVKSAVRLPADALRRHFYPPNTCFIVSPIAAGDSQTVIPALRIAAILAAAVPVPPAMIAAA